MTSVGLIPSSHLVASSSQFFSIPDILCIVQVGEGEGEGRGAVEGAVKGVVRGGG